MGQAQMSEYEIYYHPLVFEKDIPRLGEAIRRKIQRAIELRLTTHPEKYGKPLQYTLKGLWSLRVGDWRVIYKIKGSEIWVLRIGHRREVYQQGVRKSE